MSQNLAAQIALNAGGGVGFLQKDANNNLNTVEFADATLVQAASGNVANASAAATLAAVSGKTNYLSGFTITASGATAASVVTATVTGLKGGTVAYTVAVPAGVTASVQPLVVSFYPALPASAANTAIVVTLPALGSGNTNATVSATGYYK